MLIVRRSPIAVIYHVAGGLRSLTVVDVGVATGSFQNSIINQDRDQ